jgi:hypothetical protein
LIAYVNRLVKEAGSIQDGMVHVSFGIYTSSADIEALIKAIKEISNDNIDRMFFDHAKRMNIFANQSSKGVNFEKHNKRTS